MMDEGPTPNPSPERAGGIAKIAFFHGGRGYAKGDAVQTDDLGALVRGGFVEAEAEIEAEAEAEIESLPSQDGEELDADLSALPAEVTPLPRSKKKTD